jgi:hypothetical protein
MTYPSGDCAKIGAGGGRRELVVTDEQMKGTNWCTRELVHVGLEIFPRLVKAEGVEWDVTDKEMEHTNWYTWRSEDMGSEECVKIRLRIKSVFPEISMNSLKYCLCLPCPTTQQSTSCGWPPTKSPHRRFKGNHLQAG